MNYKRKTFDHPLSRTELINYPAYCHYCRGDAEIAELFIPDGRWVPLRSPAEGYEDAVHVDFIWDLTKYSCRSNDCMINGEFPKVYLVYQIKGDSEKSYMLFHGSFFTKLRFWYGSEFNPENNIYEYNIAVVTRPMLDGGTYSASGREDLLCSTWLDDIQIKYFGDTVNIGYDTPNSHRHLVDQSSNTMFVKFYVKDVIELEKHINVLLAHGFSLCDRSKSMV